MKKILWCSFTLIIFSNFAHCERLIPSKADPNFSVTREKAFLPWGTPEDEGINWKKLASSNIPVFNEHKQGALSRAIYIPNPGTGYWSLAGLSEKALWKTNHEKHEIGDQLVSATCYTDSNGDLVYWALWAPETKAHLIKDKMLELGIAPAKVELTLADKLKAFSADFAPFLGASVATILVLQFIALGLVIILFLRLRRTATIKESA